LEQDLSLAQNELSEMESLENKLMQIKDNLALAQKALLEKDSLLQEANTHLAKQILKVS
ncbi:5278_t:CDS:2, partial [Dentiscutata erythropus]